MTLTSDPNQWLSNHFETTWGSSYNADSRASAMEGMFQNTQVARGVRVLTLLLGGSDAPGEVSSVQSRSHELQKPLTCNELG